jgi:hypothetical protein
LAAVAWRAQMAVAALLLDAVVQSIQAQELCWLAQPQAPRTMQTLWL